MCVRQTIGIRHKQDEDRMTTATTLADEFKDSPRYKAILAVFTAVDELKEEDPVGNVILAHEPHHARSQRH